MPADLLSNPKKYGKDVKEKFIIEETDNFQFERNGHTLYLRNGLRRSTFPNPEKWLEIKDEVEVVSVCLVFSKYPLRNNKYYMNYPLLFNRLKNLFEIDPLLNDQLIDWKIILHTNCYNDNQVDSLFHGVVIEYKEPNGSNSIIDAENPSEDESNQTEISLDSIIAFNDFRPEFIDSLSKLDTSEAKEILVKHF